MVAKTRNKVAGDKTIVFIPFNEVNSSQHIQSTAGTIVELDGDVIRPGYHGKWGNVDYEDIICSNNSQINQKLASLNGPRDVLYIRGHCAAGSDVLESSDHTVQIDVDSLIGILSGKLSTAFPGIIKIYACDSASNLLLFFSSFAQKFATAMHKHGYTSCSYYGYTKSLSTFAYGAVDVHKRVGSDDTKRASEVRKRIYP